MISKTENELGICPSCEKNETSSILSLIFIISFLIIFDVDNIVDKGNVTKLIKKNNINKI